MTRTWKLNMRPRTLYVLAGCLTLLACLTTMFLYLWFRSSPNALLDSEADRVGKVWRLIDASRDGDVNAVRKMLNAGMDVNAQDPAGYTALHGASVYGRAHMVRFLLASGADPNKHEGNGQTPLHSAVRGNSLLCVKLLLAGGANRSVKDDRGRTALDWAEALDEAEVADVLREDAQQGQGD